MNSEVVGEKLQPVSPSFARTARRTFTLLYVVAVVAFLLAGESLLGKRAERLAVEQARLCAAALLPGQGGDLSSSIARLQWRYEGLLAVGLLDAGGGLGDLYPDRLEYRRAATATLVREPGETQRNAKINFAFPPLRLANLDAGEPGRTVWGVVASLSGDTSPTARRAVVLLSQESYRGRWVQATLVFGLVFGLAACAGLWVITRWFERRLVNPLRSLCQPLTKRGKRLGTPPAFDTGGWRELGGIASGFRELFHCAGESDARVGRVEREAQWHLQRREAGFDRQLRRARDQATIDPLTGLHNRAVLSEEIEVLVAHQRAKGEDLAVIMLDVDNFKLHNDTYGHKAGDEVLRFIGSLLRSTFRPSDVAIRYGGDEFLVLLPGTNGEQARTVIERVLKLFKQYAEATTGEKSLSLSAGVATLSGHPQAGGNELVDKADTALYAAKRKGKNAVVAG